MSNPANWGDWQREPITQGEVNTRNTWRVRTLTVLCYCSTSGPDQPNPFVDGKRHWQLLDVKQFKTMKQILNSHSFQGLYAPFNHENHLVVMGTLPIVMHITEYAINDEA